MNEHENCEERIAQLEAEVSMLRSQLRAADDRVDVKLVPLERENAELRKELEWRISESATFRRERDEARADKRVMTTVAREVENERDNLREHLQIDTKCSVYLTPERYRRYQEAEKENAELRKFKDKVRALDKLQQKDWDKPGIELAVQQLEDEIAEEVRK